MNEKKKEFDDSSSLNNSVKSKCLDMNGGVGVGIALGITMGVVFGEAYGNIVVGVALGIAFGVLVGKKMESNN
jgi:hypothetical protein